MAKLISMLLCATLLLTGCTAAVDLNTPAGTSVSATARTVPLTESEARDAALAHAGLSADQVDRLHTEYELEHGIPRYEVQFDYDGWEYDYEIHVETGEILSLDKDRND